MNTTLSGSDQATFDAIFQHPVARNLDWHDVRSLLDALANVVEEANGNLRISRHGYTLVIPPLGDKDVAEAQSLMDIRHFLQRSDGSGPEASTDRRHMLVVLDHREARVYRTEMRGSVAQRITPFDPAGFGRHLHYVQDDSNGQRKPERKSFYDSIVKTLHGAEQILIFGSSTGSSSAMDHLVADLQEHHKELAARVVGAIVVDEQHLTEDQLLAKARAFYATIPIHQIKS